MSERPSPTIAAAVGLLLGALQALPLGAAGADMQRLLAASDPFAAAPSELRVELVFSSGTSDARVPIEVWRKGDELALVRFLAPKDRGKFVVRRDRAFYFFTSNTRSPVRLAPALAPPGGAALDDLLAVRPSRDYVIESVDTTGGLVTFDLVASETASGAPRVRWVVDRADRRPVRAEFRAADGEVLRLVEFKAWNAERRLEPAAIVAKDVSRGGRPLNVEFVAIEARDVPEGLFDLTDGSARARLPAPAAP